MRASVEPPSTSVCLPLREMGIHTAATSACCWGQLVEDRRGAWFPQRPSLQRMLSCAMPLSPRVTSKQEPRDEEGVCFSTPGPQALPYSTPKPSSWGRQSQAALRAVQPILTGGRGGHRSSSIVTGEWQASPGHVLAGAPSSLCPASELPSSQLL